MLDSIKEIFNRVTKTAVKRVDNNYSGPYGSTSAWKLKSSDKKITHFEQAKVHSCCFVAHYLFSGIGRHSIISTLSPGNMEKCG